MLGSHKTVGFIASKDLRRARAFYENVLGLHFLKDDGFACVLEGGERRLRVADVSGVPGWTPLPFTVFGWEVSDVRATVSQLRERGVVCERFPGLGHDDLGVWTAPTGDRVAWFKDPDGNLLSVSSGPQGGI